MKQNANFWNRIAEKYSKSPISNLTVYEKKINITRGYLNPSMKVLEIGCGTGGTAIIHAPYVKHIRATDFSQNMIRIAQGKAKNQNINNVNFECIDVDQIDLPEKTIDVVLCMSLLHLLENKEKIIAKIYKLLKSGGIFVSSTACIQDSIKFFKWIAPLGKFLRLMPLVKCFTAQELKESIESSGFDIDYYWQPDADKVKTPFIIAKKSNAK